MLVNNENITQDKALLAASSTGLAQAQFASQSVKKTEESAVETNKAVKPTDDVQMLNELAKATAKTNDLTKASQKVDELFMQYTNRELNFEEDKATGKMVIRILDRDSGEVVRQIPPQQFLDMIASFAKFAEGMMKDLPKFV